MADLKPTPEQGAILDAAATGDGLVIEAAAGSGKTTTLKMLARQTDRRGLYLAYNRAIKDDAQRSFPSSVECKTSHGLAFGPVATRYKHRLNGPRVPAQRAAQILGVREPVRLARDLAPLAPQQLARIAVATVNRFCHSADDDITARHVPVYTGLEDRVLRAELAKAVVPIAVRAWADIHSRDGHLRFDHDHYLKIYQLSRPRLAFDYLLVDEAQDLNPVVQAIVAEQTHAQVILVGDRCQQLYAWRGAVDAMASFDGKRLQLTQSFRFGTAVADEANKWLAVLDAGLRVRGFDQVPSTVGPIEQPDAVLCRTNGTALARVMEALDNGRRVALVGGGGEIARLARAASDLMAGRTCDHPELLAFGNWNEVRDYVDQDKTASDLKVFVNLIDKWGPDVLLLVVDRLVDEQRADTVISTGHKAKGREWNTVKIATDFREPKDNEDGTRGEIPREDAMLAYVAVTRAKLGLDRAGLAWVDGYLPERYRRSAVATPVFEDVDDEDPVDELAEVAPECVRPVGPAPMRCMRCCSDSCICDPAEAARWSAITGQPAGGKPPAPVVEPLPMPADYPAAEAFGGPPRKPVCWRCQHVLAECTCYDEWHDRADRADRHG